MIESALSTSGVPKLRTWRRRGRRRAARSPPPRPGSGGTAARSRPWRGAWPAGHRRCSRRRSGTCGDVGEVGRTGERVGRPSRKRTLSPVADSTLHLPASGSTSHSQSAGPDLAALTGGEGEDVQARVLPARFPRAECDVETVREADPAGRNHSLMGYLRELLGPSPSEPSVHPRTWACTGVRPTSAARGHPPHGGNDEGARFHVEPGPFGRSVRRIAGRRPPGGAASAGDDREGHRRLDLGVQTHERLVRPRGLDRADWSSILRRSSCGPPAALTASATSLWVMAPKRRPP